MIGGSDEALRKEVLELRWTLKMKQMQEEATLKNFVSREMDLEDEIKRLKDQVVSLQKAKKEIQPPIPQDLPLDPLLMQFVPHEEDT